MRLVGSFLTLALLAPALGATNYSITTLADGVVTDGNCTLREALIAANANGVIDACPAGSASDTITLLATGTYSFFGSAVLNGPAVDVTLRGASGYETDYVLHLGEAGRFLRVLGGAMLRLEDLTVQLGDAETFSGGILEIGWSSAELDGVVLRESGASTGGCIDYDGAAGSSLVIERSTFSNCSSSAGGALDAVLIDDAVLVVRDSTFVGNQAKNAIEANGGAIRIDAAGSSTVILERLELTGNEARSLSGTTRGGALWAQIAGDSVAELADLELTDNASSGGGNGRGGGLWLRVAGTAGVMLERAELGGNGNSSAAGAQLEAEAAGSSQLTVASVLVTGGSQRGAGLSSFDQATLHAAHLTVVGHAEGVLLDGNGLSTRLHNSIVTGNTVLDLVTFGNAVATQNLVGGDPGFVDASEDDYRLSPGAPAVDAGDRTLPGLVTLDLLNLPRVAGPQTDLGAYEEMSRLVFFDHLEGGDLDAWSSVTQP